ncbi:ankyrin repeat and LEM domain-containing protein 2 [Tetranychus urticae]|uniref:ANKLE2 third alpha/beta domain-containing protein n=1 Tax=Tetranychus urticae TaxID=32264 RepID=T1JSJ4_TETUR|nr:ankyrin repeat and LEM domain-containing protein 2 [Tetranychus urticae]
MTEFHDSSSKQSIDTTPKSAKYISIILPRSVLSTNHENNTSIEELVLTDTAKAFDKLKQIKGSRLRIFDRYEDALNCSLEGIDDLQLIPEPPKEKIAENFPTPSPPELCKLRKAIECGDFDLVYSLITENPKYVITSSDTPVILMEGPRFNGVHIACRCNQIEILEFILKTINNPDFIKKLYPNDSDAVTEETRKHLLDLYLNTPDKAALDTPLHFASKFAAADCVKLLLTYPGCDRERRNKFGETPYDVICSRKRDSQAYEKIKEYFEARFYISIMRKYDRVTVCTPSETPPKDDSISGIAGPMSPKLAEEIYSKLKSPAKSTSPRKFNIRLTDGSRGVERVARMECRYHNLDWVEYWPFLNCYVDLASPEGLEMLEKHLAKMHGLASKQPNGEESSSDKTHEKSSVSLLCDRLGLLSLASNQSIDGELIKSQEVNSSDDDDDYVTPPSSPVQVDFFVNGKSFSQSDKDAANALADIKINAFRFPYTAQWLRKVKREKSMTSPSEETFVNFCDKVAANIAHSTPRKSINLIDLISPRRFHGLSDQQSSTEISGDDDVFHESFR